MQRSNLYIIIFTAILTAVSGLLLSVASLGLKPLQEANIALERKYNILSSAIDIDASNKLAITETYDKRVRSYVIDANGKKIAGVATTDVNIEEEYKKDPKTRKYPIFEILNNDNQDKIDYYVIPLYGFGLWNNIWGYVALEPDINTIKGVKFDHAGETPGLGARIATAEIESRYVGKKIFDNGKFVSIAMMKGEGNDYSTSPHRVDGMSGATITAKGLNEMLFKYLGGYEPFLKSRRDGNDPQTLNQ